MADDGTPSTARDHAALSAPQRHAPTTANPSPGPDHHAGRGDPGPRRPRRHQGRLRRRLPRHHALDDPTFADCLGYQGQIYEDRHGVYNLTIHTRGSIAGVVHVEGDVSATFTISPLHGAGVVYRGTYREHAAGNFLVIDGQDVPHPAAFYYLHGTGAGSDGSQIRFTSQGHFVLDKRTGQVRRDATTSTCRMS
jgi:hypothetical protein